MKDSPPHAALCPRGGRVSCGCCVRAGARKQRRVRTTAKRLLAAQWPPPPPQRDRGARAAALEPPLESGARGRPAGSPRSPARVRTRRACARLLPPPPPRPTAAGRAQPPRAHRRQHELMPGVSSSRVQQSSAAVAASPPHRIASSSNGFSERRHDSRVDAPTRAASSKRGRFREGRCRGGACRGCRAESAPAARKRGGQRVTLFPSAERSPRAGRG